MTTTNMSLNEPSVGVTTGPTWATQTNSNWETIDTHDHTSGKGVQLTPSALNINADLEFNQNSATELKNVIFDSSVTAATTNYSVYQSGGNLYWRNGSGTAVQITDGSGINTSGGSISNMTGNSQVQFSGVNKSYTFKFDSTLSDGIAKLVMSDIQLYFYNGGSATTRSVNLKYTGSGTGANTLTVPDETGTLLSTATSFAGVINIATSSSNAAINLKPNGTGHVVVGNGSATGKLTSNGAYDLVLDTNSGTNSGSITITDGADGNIAITPNGTGKVDISKVDIDGGTLGGFTIDGNWTAAGQTCADLGSVTTCDINGGTINGITDLAVADGGTGASSASDARTNLGVAIGSDVQAYDADLAAIAGLAKTNGNFIVGNGSAWVAESGSTARTSIGLGNVTNESKATMFSSPTFTGTIGGGAIGPSVTMSANQACVKTALNASGSAPIYACRVWVNFNGTGTVAIRDSGNVTSITDIGVGKYTVNFTTAMPDVNYAFSGVIKPASTADADGAVIEDRDITRTTSSLSIQTKEFSSDFTDPLIVNIIVIR